MGNALLKDRRTPRRVRAVSVAEHDRLLTRVFREAKHRVVVASPYVSVLAIRAAGVDATIRDVRARGVQVTVYATLARDKPPHPRRDQSLARRGRECADRGAPALEDADSGYGYPGGGLV